MPRRKTDGTPPKRRARRGSATALERQLSTLQISDLIVLARQQPELEYGFRHALVQEAAYDSVLKHQRRALHQAIGLTLEQFYPERVNELASMLAHHFWGADDYARALKYCTLAGDLAARQYANVEAQMQYERALFIVRQMRAEHATLLHLFSALGRVLEHLGRYADAVQTYLDMEGAARERGDRPLELAALVAQATIRSAPTDAFDPAEAERLADRSLALARELGDRAAEVRVISNRALLYKFQGRWLESLAYGEQAAAGARELDQRESLAHILNDVLASYTMTGEPSRSRAALSEAGSIWRALQNLPMLADNLSTSAQLEFALGDYERALTLSQEAYQVSLSINNVWNQAYAQWILGNVLLERGEMDRALNALGDAITLSEQAGFIVGQIAAPSLVGVVYAYLGNCERAQAYMRRSLDLTAEKLSGWMAIPASVSAIIQVWCGQLTTAATLIEQARPNLQAGDLQSAIVVTIAETELAAATGDYERGLRLSDEHAAVGAAPGTGAFFGWLVLPRAECQLALGRWDDAYAALARARANEEAHQGRRLLWKILALLSVTEAQRGNTAEAVRLRAEARDVLSFIAGHISDPTLRAGLFSRPDVRALLEPA